MSSEVADQATGAGGLSPVAAAEVLAATMAGTQSALACWELGIDGELRLVAANERYLAFARRPGEHLIGQRLADVQPGLPDEAGAIMRHVVSSGEPFHLERLAQHDEEAGSTYWDVVLVPVRVSGTRLVVSAQDVTELSDISPTLTAENRFLRDRTERESVRLEALARVAGAATLGGGFDSI